MNYRWYHNKSFALSFVLVLILLSGSVMSYYTVGDPAFYLVDTNNDAFHESADMVVVGANGIAVSMDSDGNGQFDDADRADMASSLSTSGERDILEKTNIPLNCVDDYISSSNGGNRGHDIPSPCLNGHKCVFFVRDKSTDPDTTVGAFTFEQFSDLSSMTFSFDGTVAEGYWFADGGSIKGMNGDTTNTVIMTVGSATIQDDSTYESLKTQISVVGNLPVWHRIDYCY